MGSDIATSNIVDGPTSTSPDIVFYHNEWATILSVFCPRWRVVGFAHDVVIQQDPEHLKGVLPLPYGRTLRYHSTAVSADAHQRHPVRILRKCSNLLTAGKREVILVSSCLRLVSKSLPTF